jgi:GTP-binding protein LepA
MTDSRIRNFCIIAHIDHGKSTLADRLLEITGAVAQREMKAQVLDNMDLERERGITIKLQAARMDYKAKSDGENYILNLIDTPGHVDFGYEVSRSLAACEGALLVVDATQGVEAQTLANVYLAIEHNLEIIPVLNKVDLPSAEPDKIKKQIEEAIGIDASDALMCSAKTGVGVDDILEAIVQRVPSAPREMNKPLKALVFDSYFDPYLGIVTYFRVIEGQIRKGDKVTFMANEKTFDVTELGVMTPSKKPVDVLSAGEVGYMAASIKQIGYYVGDTITLKENPAPEPLPGYKKAKPMVFCGLYPVNNEDYQDLKDALDKLQLNDSSITFEPETSEALGFGYRCGFLGMLHMEIIQERLEREFNLDLIVTAPSVVYQVYLRDGTMVEVDNPAKLPSPIEREYIMEPLVGVKIFTPTDYVGQLMELAQTRRGNFLNMDYIDPTRVNLQYDLPLNEMVTDFYDQLKSRSKGYASLDYYFKGYQRSKLVKLDILIAGESVDALSVIVHEEKAFHVGRALTDKLRELIPRQLFEVAIQAAIGGKVVARSTVKAMRKNVLDKCYGGDISRKRKLLEKQKKGKKRMKSVGSVEIPQEAFMAVLTLTGQDE